MAGHERMVDDGHARSRGARYSLGAVSEARPQRGAEGARSRSGAHARARAGARRRGPWRDRPARHLLPRRAQGRLKLREEEPGEAHLIAYSRPDAADGARVELPRRAGARPGGLRAALARPTASTSWSTSGGGCCCGRRSASTSTRSTGLGSFLELEAVAEPDSDLDARAARRSRSCATALRSATRRCARAPTRTRCARRGRRAPDPELLALAREAAGRAYAPYSNFPVGAAVRTADGRRYAGANVENAAYPQGQCAEASALGAMVAGGGGRVVEVVVAAPSAEECAPCGGCRQRLREFADQDAPIHLADMERVRRTTSLAELLPLSFGPESLG